MNTQKSRTTQTAQSVRKSAHSFVMSPRKYKILLAGIAALLTGYFLMSGGGNPDPAVFDESIFSFRRITLAPIVVLLGYLLVGISIMYPEKSYRN
jgi:hypothetical protein